MAAMTLQLHERGPSAYANPFGMIPTMELSVLVDNMNPHRRLWEHFCEHRIGRQGQGDQGRLLAQARMSFNDRTIACQQEKLQQAQVAARQPVSVQDQQQPAAAAGQRRTWLAKAYEQTRKEMDELWDPPAESAPTPVHTRHAQNIVNQERSRYRHHMSTVSGIKAWVRDQQRIFGNREARQPAAANRDVTSPTDGLQLPAEQQS